jgi:predicted enzyme related to lactoylglutathione lyase
MTTFILNIDVPSIEVAERFYTTAFELAVGRPFGAEFVELSGWPVSVYLLQKKAGTIGARHHARNYDRHWTPVHPDVVVTDLDAALARAITAGAVVERSAVDVPYGRIATRLRRAALAHETQDGGRSIRR